MHTKGVVYVFIDASNLWAAFKAKGRFIDFEKTVGYIKRRFEASDVKVFYYTAYPAEGTRPYSLAVFFTGDSDFLALVTYLRKHGKKVFIFSSKNNISQELRTGADGYTDILDIEGVWGKELKHREELEKETK